MKLAVFLKDSYDLEGQWMFQRVRLPGYPWNLLVFIKYSVATESISKNSYPTPNFPLVQMWSCGRWSLGWLWAVQKWRHLWPAIISSQDSLLWDVSLQYLGQDLGNLLPQCIFFLCVQMPWGPDNVILLRHSEALRCCKTWHMRIASHRPTPPPINKHASCSSPKINVYQKWHFSTSLILSKVSVWQRRGKGRQVHLLNCSVWMWRSWAGSPITIEGLQDTRVWECKCFGKAGNRGARRLWSVWLCHGYLSAHDKERKNNMVRKTEQLYL